MILDQITNKNDEWYTPRYAIKPLLKYLKPNSTIWCPFDKEESEYVKIFKENGFKVINTHISSGGDFFKIEVPECDYIISNPPYSLKTQILERLFELKKPFAMLISCAGIFESKKRFNLFKNNPVEVMIFNKRIVFYNEDWTQKKQPPFSSWYICSKLLKEQLIFEVLNNEEEQD